MKTYILFIYGKFDQFDNLENFCKHLVEQVKFINAYRFIVEKSENIILIFDTKMDEEVLMNEINQILINDQIKFYFMFDRSTIVSAYIPPAMKNFLFEAPNNKLMKIEYKLNEKNVFNLDEILDKIEKSGIESLTLNEKKYLDNFEM